MTVTVQPNHEPSTLKFSYENPDPETEFVLANETVFPSEAAFRDRIRGTIRAQPPGSVRRQSLSMATMRPMPKRPFDRCNWIST
ncbi:MAG: hypothetical protein GDA40_11950 [Rhodobacteraceae bacterium]|nr:hypothetical protein [Paracoccaceae bacterium]